MLPKRNRLKEKKDIERVFQKGKSFKEDSLILKKLKNSVGNPRFSFIVSQKVSKKANLRNKLKRKLRELIRMKLKKLRQDIDVLIIAAPGLEVKGFWEIEEICDRLLRKAGIMR